LGVPANPAPNTGVRPSIFPSPSALSGFFVSKIAFGNNQRFNGMVVVIL